MKRILCLILSLAVVFSCFAITNLVFAETTGSASADSAPIYKGAVTGTALSTTFYTCTDGKNTLTNASFEGASIDANKVNASSFSGNVSVTDENSFEGEKSLKFEAGDTEEVATLIFDVTPNTDYQFSLFMNCSDYDYENKSNLTFGISDPETGYFIDSTESLNLKENINNDEYSGSVQYIDHYKTYQMSPSAYDNEWHMTGGFFSTGSKTQLGFTVRAKNVTAFIDKICIFKTTGDVVLGTTHSYWNLAKYWEINDGVMSFKSKNYSSNHHDFVLNLRLDNTLTSGNKYTLSTDMTLSADSYLKNFSLYYADNLGLAATGDATADGKTPQGATALYENYYSILGSKKMPTQNFTFTPSDDLLAKGYITLRIHVKPANVTATATKFELKDSNGNLINTWDFTGFENGVYTGTDAQWSDSDIKGWFPELTEYDTDVLNLRNAGGIKYIAPLQNLEHAVLTNTNATLLGTTDSKNLVKNFDFSSADTSFWTDNTSATLGDTLNIINTSHSIQGKAFLYDSNRKYPYGIYYIKWIDVEPNTEYTFSARYSIEETGEGFIGIVDGYRNDKVEITQNTVFPKLIGKIGFTEDKFIEGYEWQSSGFSFNTKERNRVGIAILDKGGKAYLDDIRLFKTSDATELTVIEDNTPDNITSDSENITIDSGEIKLSGNETTLSALKENLNYGSNIKAFKADGTELGADELIGTGTIIKLMNGNVLKDTATVILAGDINGDGLINAEDLAVMKKVLLNKYELGGVFVTAADLHEDGKVNIIDLVALKKLIINNDDRLVASVKNAVATQQVGFYNIPFEVRNFDKIEIGGAYYFKIKLPSCVKVEGVSLDGQALIDPDYENHTGEYSVNNQNELVLSNFFNTDSGDTLGKTARWDIEVSINDSNSKGSFPIEVSEESYAIDMETNLIEFFTENGVIIIK